MGRNIDGPEEKQARKNDLNRIKDYLNKNSRGPGIPAGNITAVTGADTSGATPQEVCDAIDGLQGQGCEKIWFFWNPVKLMTCFKIPMRVFYFLTTLLNMTLPEKTNCGSPQGTTATVG